MPELVKVAHVMRRFSPEKWGGTESVVYNVTRELQAQGIESPVFCTDMFSRPGVETVGEVTVRRFRYLFPWFGLSSEAKSRLRSKGGSPLSLSLFFGLLRERNVSVIHAHVQHRLGGMARTAAKLKGIPYVVSVHGGHFTLPADQVEKMTEPFRGRFEWGKAFGFLFGSRRVLRDASAILCVGENEFLEMRQRYPSSKVVHMPNGVEVARFAGADSMAFRKMYGFAECEKIVLCVSRIDYQKNQVGLVRAFAQFSQTHPDHRLVLIGPVTVADYHRELINEVARHGLNDCVQIIEGLAPDDPLLPGAYKAAEMFVLPTRHEPFGIVVLEAWAAGIPVVAYAVGGITGFAADRKNILLVEKDDEQALSMRMNELAGDPLLRKSLSSAAYAEVRGNYDWSSMGVRFRELYEGIIRKA